MTTAIDTNVITTVTYTQDSILRHFVDMIPNLVWVSDESLSFETGVQDFRDDEHMRNAFRDEIPLLIFKRSVLRPGEALMGGKRSVVQKRTMRVKEDGNASLYRPFYGDYDFQFMFVCRAIEHIEHFEVSYLSEEGFPSKKEVSVDYTNIGTFPYYLTYNPLEERIVNLEGNFYKALSGSITVRGWYFVFRDAAKRIYTINLDIKNYQQKLLCRKTITAE